ncbi:hypothetical protein C8J56DRAFT_916891 [Mycena floridula]|nr:hypothetical protein C8J56DRAFT_916891 [Mycena floridula]
MSHSFEVVNDTIISHGGSYDYLTPREIAVRDAMLIMTILAPFMAAVVVGFFSRRKSSVWTFPNLSILWFLSVGCVGIFFFYQRGVATRTTMMLAILHTQIEVLINSLLLKASLRKGLTITAIWGFVLYLLVLALPSITGTFFATTIMGGAGDFLMFLILAYGRKYLYAIGAFFHVFNAVWIFVDSAIFIEVVLYNTLTFVAVWLHLAFTTAAIVQDSDVETDGQIQLPTSETRVGESSELFDAVKDRSNPMHDINVPTKVLVTLIGVSLLGSTGISVIIYLLA